MPVFPSTGGGSTAPAGIPPYQIFVDPGGSDSAIGSQGAPMKTLYAATARAISLGGGTIIPANNTRVGGPIVDQGLWLRNDGVDVPGFLDIKSHRLRFVGNGSQSSQFVFQRPGACNFIGGSLTDYTKPCLWIVGSFIPIDFDFMQSSIDTFNGYAAPCRLGWDYARKDNFALESLTVTNATRASRSTVFTLDLTSASAWTVTHADRDTFDTVTLTLARPATVAMSPWQGGALIRVNTGGDTDFPNGDFTVTQQSDALNLSGQTTITVSYQQAGATINKALSGTVKSHGCGIGDVISVDSSNAEFVSASMMTVTAFTIDTVTVFDPYGYSPRSASANQNNIGTIVKQIRGRMVADGVAMEKSSFFGLFHGISDQFYACPTIDMGGTSASATVLREVYSSGSCNFPVSGNNYDPDRTRVSVYASPGAAGSSTSFSAYRCQSQDGCIRWYANNAGGDLYVNWWLQDSGGASFPTVQALGGNTNGSVFADNIAQADSSAEAVTVSAGFDYTKVIIRKVYSSASPPVVSDSGCIGPENLRLANWTTNGIASPWKLGWNTVWTGGLSTPHPGSNRAFGPVQARFTNLMPALDDWDSAGPLPTGITLTADGAAPDGTNTAIKVVADNTFVVDQVVIGAYPATLSASVGDHVFMGVWIKSTVGAVLQMSTFGAGDVEFDGAGVIGASRHIAQDGWQWCTTRATVTAITNGHYFLVLSIPAGAGTYYLFGPTVIVASDALAKDCDFFEYAGTAKHQPQYLTAGQQGTMEGQKFIADGGLGTNSANAKVVGAGSGQLTLTGTGTVYLPEYDRDGTTIIGWKAMLQATVNP